MISILLIPFLLFNASAPIQNFYPDRDTRFDCIIQIHDKHIQGQDNLVKGADNVNFLQATHQSDNSHQENLPVSDERLSQKDLIEWESKRRLNWSDFKGAVPVNAANAALTNTAINVEFGFSKNGMTYSIRCRFDKNKSWVRIKNDLVLGHEQGHFDIAEIHARKLNKALKEYKYNSRTVNNDVNRIYENVMKDHHAFQSEYDQQTDFSRKVDKQKEWLNRIADELKTFEEYASYTQELL